MRVREFKSDSTAVEFDGSTMDLDLPHPNYVDDARGQQSTRITHA
jgi:hypothetical protein